MFDLFVAWFATQLGTVTAWFLVGCYTFLNQMIQSVCDLMTFCVALLPEITLPTFGQMAEGGNDFLMVLNWFIPVDLIVSLLGLWLVSEIAFFALSPMLRFARMIAR